MAGKDAHTVDCACGKVQLEVSGSPMQSWCHCYSCAKFHQTTPVAFIMFAAQGVKVVQGQDHIQRVSLRKPEMGRFFCAVSTNRSPGIVPAALSSTWLCCSCMNKVQHQAFLKSRAMYLFQLCVAESRDIMWPAGAMQPMAHVLMHCDLVHCRAVASGSTTSQMECPSGACPPPM